MKKYLIIPFLVFFIAGCGDNSKELLDQAEKNAKENKIEESANLYEQLIKENPEGDYTAKACYDLGTIYKNGLHPKLSREIQLSKAIEYYTIAFEKFPESKESPQSLFMIGFIQNNELLDYAAATKTYKTFITKFPNHELAASANAELNNMGLTPEQILEKRLAKTNN